MGILAGLLFYFYPYYWTFAMALLAVSDLRTFWQKKKILWQYLYKYLLIIGLASWYLVHLWQIHQLSYYRESMVRIGALYSRWPAGLYTQAVLLASLAAFFLLKKYVFPKIDLGMSAGGALDKIAFGLIAGLIVLNQQIITGVQLESNSHYLPTILLFLVAFWGNLIFILINNLNSYRQRQILAYLSFLLAIGLAVNRVYLISADFGVASKEYVGGQADRVVNWFLKNNVRDKVVYAPNNLREDITLWTNNYIYFDPGQELQLMPTIELIDRFTYYDLTNKDITDHLFDWQNTVFGMTFIEPMQKDNVVNKIKAVIRGKKFVPATLEQYTNYDFKPLYEKRINSDAKEFIRYLDKYQVNYLVYRQKDRESIYKLVPGKIVFEDEDFIIKQIN